MRRECRERFPRYHGFVCGKNVPGIPGACATRNFTYLVRDSCLWWEIDIHGCYKLVKINFVPICVWKINRRMWCHNASSSPSRDVIDQLWSRQKQATGLDAWASRVKCPAQFVSHLHEICIYIYELFIAFFLFITVTWWYVWCIEWASGDQEEVQACLVTLWLFIVSCYSLYKTTTNPHFHKYSMDFHV